MARMLGTCRQPFCKKCCGTRLKSQTQVMKRREKRAEKAELRLDVLKDRV